MGTNADLERRIRELPVHQLTLRDYAYILGQLDFQRKENQRLKEKIKDLEKSLYREEAEEHQPCSDWAV